MPLDLSDLIPNKDAGNGELPDPPKLVRDPPRQAPDFTDLLPKSPMRSILEAMGAGYLEGFANSDPLTPEAKRRLAETSKEGGIAGAAADLAGPIIEGVGAFPRAIVGGTRAAQAGVYEGLKQAGMSEAAARDAAGSFEALAGLRGLRPGEAANPQAPRPRVEPGFGEPPPGPEGLLPGPTPPTEPGPPATGPASPGVMPSPEPSAPAQIGYTPRPPGQEPAPPLPPVINLPGPEGWSEPAAPTELMMPPKLVRDPVPPQASQAEQPPTPTTENKPPPPVREPAGEVRLGDTIGGKTALGEEVQGTVEYVSPQGSIAGIIDPSGKRHTLWTETAVKPVLEVPIAKPQPLIPAVQSPELPGPWEQIGVNNIGDAVYKNPHGVQAVMEDGVPWAESVKPGPNGVMVPKNPSARKDVHSVVPAAAPQDDKEKNKPAPEKNKPAKEVSPEAEITPAKSKWTEVGQNADGETLYEDDRGVRSIVTDGIRETESVRVNPEGKVSVEREPGSRFAPKTETVANLPPPAKPKPGVATSLTATDRKTGEVKKMPLVIDAAPVDKPLPNLDEPISLDRMLRAKVAELDDRKSPDTAYRALLGDDEPPLAEGKTWRERVIERAEESKTRPPVSRDEPPPGLDQPRPLTPDQFDARLGEKIPSKKSSPAVVEHPGLVITSLQTGKTTKLQPIGTVPPQLDPAPNDAKSGADEPAPPDNEALFDEAQEIMRKLPRDMGKVKREGKVTPRQQQHMDRLDEIEKLLPPTSPEWKEIADKRRAAAEEKYAQEAKAREVEERERLKKADLAEGDRVEMVIPSGLPTIPPTRVSGKVKIGKDGQAYVSANGQRLDPFDNPWNKVQAIDPPAPQPQGTPPATGTAPELNIAPDERISPADAEAEPARADDDRVGQPESGGTRPPGTRGRKPSGKRDPVSVADKPPGDDGAADQRGGAGQDGVRVEPSGDGERTAIPESGDAANGREGTSDEGLADAGTGDGSRPVVPDLDLVDPNEIQTPPPSGREVDIPAVTRPNYHLVDPERIVGGTPKVRFRHNKDALETLARLEDTGEIPTSDDLDQLAGFIGWGSFGQDLFQGTYERQPQREGWDAESKWLREELGKQAWESARDSIINAHYTDPPTVETMWNMVRQMGFQGGRILEPSMGIGNFFGLMPRDIMDRSQLTGIELDRRSADMAKMLYPHANIRQMGYEESKTPDGHYDLVIGNWPFAAQSPPDRRYDRLKPTLHDYFFLKALDQTRPGGLVVGITSAGTMDKSGRSARLEMARKGDLIAAFRLPSGAFEKYAGTKVVTDILVLRKRETPNVNPQNEPWIEATEMDTPSGDRVRVNNYFQQHPENVLGTIDFGHGTTTYRPGLIVNRPADMMERLTALPEKLPADAYKAITRGGEPRYTANTTDDRQLSIVVGDDGELHQILGDVKANLSDVDKTFGKMQPKTKAQRVEEIGKLVRMRKTYFALLDAERLAKPITEDLRADLKAQYEAFVKAHGKIAESPSLTLMKRVRDPSYPMLRSLERPDGTLSGIMTEAVSRSRARSENPTIPEAYVMARNETLDFSSARVAELAKKPIADVEKQLLDVGAVYRTPGGGLEPADRYLSGNVRRKLREAEFALEGGEDMAKSVEALKGVIPKTTPYYNIEAKMGAPWISPKFYRDFVGELLKVRPDDMDAIDIKLERGRWRVDLGRFTRTPEAESIHGHPRYPFNKLVRAAMENTSPRISDPKDKDGGPYFNEKATEEVNAKVQELREKFQDWVWRDPERKIDLEKAFNENMNAVVGPKFDGSFMDMSGMSLRRGEDPFNLRRHQMNAIWRGIMQRRGLFAHEVGTGKAQPLDAKVLTPDGWKCMGEIAPGDVVIAGDGSPTLVEAIFPQGDKAIFRVTFSDGSTAECCDEHLWLTQTYRERNQAINGRRAGKVWPCAQAKVRTLSEIRSTLVSPHLGAKNHSIPMVGTVQFKAAPLPLDPYVMGVLLGDGGFTSRSVTFSSADQEIVFEMQRLLPQDCEVMHRGTYNYGIRWNGAIQYAVGGFGPVRSHPVIKALESVGVWGLRSHEKFIPAAYLINSIETRIALLQGLMDTDGTADRRGCGISYCTTSLRLADDVTALVQSLGGIVTRRLRYPKFKRAGVVALGRLAYTLNVSLPANVLPFRLTRKAALVVPKTKYPPRRFIVAVEAVGTKPAQCIRIAHPSHLYVTDNFIVTHNTYTIGGIAIEGKRYGIHKKPLIFGHNANSSSLARDVQEMYPGARVLYVDNLSPKDIKTTLYRIKNEDWDAIIMPHSVIDNLSLKEETLRALAAEQIAALEEEAIQAAQQDDVKLTVEDMDDEKKVKNLRSSTAKRLVNARNAIIANIKKQANKSSKEDAIAFEDLGVDAILVDEAHEFKKPPIETVMNVKGLNTQTSNRSIAMNFLTGYVRGVNDGNGVYLFTGTPITNTLNEIFNMSRYFMEDTLKRGGIDSWGQWFNTFADATSDVELVASGDYMPIKRLSSFVNTDELVRVMSEFTDVVQAKDMPEFVDRTTKSGKNLSAPDLTDDERAELEYGRTSNPVGRPYKRVINDVAEMAPYQRGALEEQRKLYREFKAASGKQRREWQLSGDPHNPVVIETNIANASMDARLYSPEATDDPSSKVNRVVKNVARIYKEPNAAQVIFMEKGYNPGKRNPDFTLTNDLVAKLVASGIPREQIKIVGGGVTPEQKKKMADDMNTGKLRVVIGLTDTLGVGVNMQKNLRAMHHFDAPWRPGDLEQRDGRGHRQGNEWNTVLEYRYITEGIDGRRWQVLTTKDRFIKQFISAFNNDSGERIGSIEGDAADVSDDEDIMSTLSEAAGDPRLMIREKIRADINRLERRERTHTQGVAEARERARYTEKDADAIEARARSQAAAIKKWDAASEKMVKEAEAAGEKRRFYDAEIKGKPYRVGDEIQQALDDAIGQLVPGEKEQKIGTINGIDIKADWSARWNKQPYYELTNGTQSLKELTGLTLPRITGAIRAAREEMDQLPVRAAERREQAQRLKEAGDAPFSQTDQLIKKRQQMARLEQDMEENPIPAPGWLRYGAPIDADVFVNGEQRTVRGHRVGEDFYLVTDEGDVPYLEARDKNGMPVYEKHDPPVKIIDNDAPVITQPAGDNNAGR